MFARCGVAACLLTVAFAQYGGGYGSYEPVTKKQYDDPIRAPLPTTTEKPILLDAVDAYGGYKAETLPPTLPPRDAPANNYGAVELQTLPPQDATQGYGQVELQTLPPQDATQGYGQVVIQTPPPQDPTSGYSGYQTVELPTNPPPQHDVAAQYGAATEAPVVVLQDESAGYGAKETVAPTQAVLLDAAPGYGSEIKVEKPIQMAPTSGYNVEIAPMTQATIIRDVAFNTYGEQYSTSPPIVIPMDEKVSGYQAQIQQDPVTVTTPPAYGAYNTFFDRPQFSCVGRLDGFYVAGCNNKYWSCSGNIAMEHVCSEGTWYSVETQRCDSKEWVVECGGQVPPPTTPAPQRDNSVADNLCRTKMDGLYSIGSCIEEFLHCSGGVGTISKCQAGLHFDVKSGACETLDICSAPPVQKDTASYNSYGYQAATQAPPAQDPISRTAYY